MRKDWPMPESRREIPLTPEGHVVSRNLSDVLLHVSRGSVERLNAYFEFMADTSVSREASRIFSRLSAVPTRSEASMGNPDSVVIEMRGPEKASLNSKTTSIAFVKITDHASRQRVMGKSTEVMMIGDIITWTENGVCKGKWSENESEMSRIKNSPSNDVKFTMPRADGDKAIAAVVKKALELVDVHSKSLSIDLGIDFNAAEYF